MAGGNLRNRAMNSEPTEGDIRRAEMLAERKRRAEKATSQEKWAVSLTAVSLLAYAAARYLLAWEAYKACVAEGTAWIRCAVTLL